MTQSVDNSDSPSAVLYLATWLPTELHTEFSEWCDEHHREQLRLPGFRRARRFEKLESFREDDPPQFLTMYDLSSLAALNSDEYREHSRSSPGLPEFLKGMLRLERRDCSVLATLPSSWWPPTSTTLLDVFQLNDDRLALNLRDQISTLSDTENAFPEFSLRVIDSVDNEPLVLIDHGPAFHDLIDTLTAASGSLRSSWRCCFNEQSPL